MKSNVHGSPVVLDVDNVDELKSRGLSPKPIRCD